jgi:thiamine biosynthesis lipoprotein
MAAVLAGIREVDRGDIEINRAASTVFLGKPGMILDLGAIAKGFAADQGALILEKAGVKAAVIDLGGNILVYGEKPGRVFSPRPRRTWRVGIQDPRDTRGSYIGVLETPGKSVVTSGVYERYFTRDGKRYHHILSTETGYPVENGLLSVTVIADHSIDADALSTAAFALGWEKGAALLGKTGAEGIFVFEDQSVRVSPGLRESFTLSETSGYFLDPS